MIVGVGIDVVDVERFKWMMRRSPGVLDRLLTAAEQRSTGGAIRSAESLAARFAAKEAVAKALGSPSGLDWHDCHVEAHDDGAPRLRMTGAAADIAAERGITNWHLSISHDGGVAVAYVIAEARDVSEDHCGTM